MIRLEKPSTEVSLPLGTQVRPDLVTSIRQSPHISGSKSGQVPNNFDADYTRTIFWRPCGPTVPDQTMHYDTSAENSRIFFGRFLDVHVKSKSPCKLLL